jgi:hypothetical protein
MSSACIIYGMMGGESWRSRRVHRKTDADPSSFTWIIQSLSSWRRSNLKVAVRIDQQDYYKIYYLPYLNLVPCRSTTSSDLFEAIFE